MLEERGGALADRFVEMTKKVDEAEARLGKLTGVHQLAIRVSRADLRLVLDDRKACWDLLRRTESFVRYATEPGRASLVLEEIMARWFADFERLKGDELGEQQMANAYPIAAAPELLEALCEIIRYVPQWENYTGTDGRNHALKRSVAAIAKVRGDSDDL